MTVRLLSEAMKRVKTWPEEAQEELAEIALEIDATLKDGVYHATDHELAGIDRGLRAATEGRIATDDALASLLAKHRPA